MRITDIIHEFNSSRVLDEAPTFSKEIVGNFIIIAGDDPVNDAVSGKPTYKAVVKPKAKQDRLLFSTNGMTQSQAIEQARDWIIKQSRPDEKDYDRYKGFNINLNAQFIQQYYDEKSGAWFKLDNDGGPVLVMANPEWVATFPSDLKDLKFQKATARSSIKNPGEARDYGFPVSPAIVKQLQLIPNGRYTLKDPREDKDGNSIWTLDYDSRTQSPRDKVRLGEPALTVAAY